jgi:hypothetical protein
VQLSPYAWGLHRWASLDDEEPQEERASKRAAKRAAIAAKGVASPTGSELRPKNRWDSGAPTVAKEPGLKKSVRWADEVVHTGGFSIGGASKQQVTTQTFVASCHCIATVSSLISSSSLSRLTSSLLHGIRCVLLVDYVQGCTRVRGCVRFRTACLRVAASLQVIGMLLACCCPSTTGVWCS